MTKEFRNLLLLHNNVFFVRNMPLHHPLLFVKIQTTAFYIKYL